MKSPSAATTSSSLDWNQLQALLRSSLGIAEDLHDGVDQGLHDVVRGPIGISLSHAAHKIVQRIAIR
jgi:hypothetical protein